MGLLAGSVGRSLAFAALGAQGQLGAVSKEGAVMKRWSHHDKSMIHADGDTITMVTPAVMACDNEPW
jgi:hypothetical protein